MAKNDIDNYIESKGYKAYLYSAKGSSEIHIFKAGEVPDFSKPTFVLTRADLALHSTADDMLDWVKTIVV